MYSTQLRKPTIVFVASYPPRECGIATFTQDLVHAFQTLIAQNATIKVAAINQPSVDHTLYPIEVAWIIDQENKDEYRQLAQQLNEDDSVVAVVVQHEYGIFGGRDGEYILELVHHLKKPIITSMHTILSAPKNTMRTVTQHLVDHSQAVVVLSNESKQILMKLYDVPSEKIQFIPHGIHPTVFQHSSSVKPKLRLDNRTMITTFGLLSRGKGIEYVLRALPEVIAHHPDLTYLILGETHPVVARREGESYRRELLELVHQLGIADNVTFIDHYLSLEDILTYLQATDVYIATSLSSEQSVSGTFSYALGAGRAVVSTAFRQAKEVITPEVGRLVPIGDVHAYSDALLDLLDDPQQLKRMHKEAYKRTRTMIWPNVAHEYCKLLSTIPGCNLTSEWYIPAVKLDHLERMTDQFGLLQFSTYDEPNRAFGYTLDDNARAIIALLLLAEADMVPLPQATRLISLYSTFMERCRQRDDSCINYLSGDQLTRTGQNDEEDLSDCVSRAWWAACELLACSWVPEVLRERAAVLVRSLSRQCLSVPHVRAKAFSILGLVAVCRTPQKEQWSDQLAMVSHELVNRYYETRSRDWHWFEHSLTYANGMLPLSLLKANEILGDEKIATVARESLDFLISQCFFGDVYMPIGQRLWSNLYGVRGFFDQQPEDPASTMLALTTAYAQFGDERYAYLAQKCFSWFLGNNVLGEPLYNPFTGGCFDGLSKAGASLNQGAESTVSYLFARWAIELCSGMQKGVITNAHAHFAHKEHISWFARSPV